MNGTDFEDELAREAAQVAAEHIEDRGRDVDRIVVIVEVEGGGGAIVGLRELGEDDHELLAQLIRMTTVFAGTLGKTILLVEA